MTESQVKAIAELHGKAFPDLCWCDQCLQERGMDYENDLNAVHEVEKLLPDQTKYEETLRRVCDHDWQHAVVKCSRNPIYAKASQRSEAILRSIGKWGL